jgi:hypothetical protein
MAAIYIIKHEIEWSRRGRVKGQWDRAYRSQGLACAYLICCSCSKGHPKDLFTPSYEVLGL